MASLDEIYLKAREIGNDRERAAYVASACGDDAALLVRVEAMLRDADSAEDFFGSVEKAAVFRDSLAEPPGTVIGRYKLLEKIGEGGFGVVYLAEQKDPVKRRVALKIIKPGMDSQQVVARFEAERQALALMDHPNIAKVFDGGAMETGRPYFVMELVRGVPITNYCDENKLLPRERLELFLHVCQAVQHAHQKGIIHRDLKPSNVLVTVNDGMAVPKVIDFGVAKATQQELTEKTILTHFHQFIGTPAYMSPEQVEMTSVDIDTRSDIYSLGVLLYELLTGKTPFDAKELLQAGLDELRHTIREKVPPRPSTKLRTLRAEELTTAASRRRTEGPKLIDLLRSDLDWIVMRCLEKDRNRRYDTANGVAADIQAHLKSEPISARPPSAAYRLQKFIGRNRLQFAAATTVAIALILGSVVSTWLAIRESRARKAAKAEASKAVQAEQTALEQAANAQAVKDFMVENLLGIDCCSDSPDPDAISSEATLALVEKVARRIESKFTNQPQTEAEIRFALVRAFGTVHDHRKAADQADKVLVIRQRLLGPQHSDTLDAVKMLAFSKYQVGQKSEAFRLLDEAIATVRGTNPLSPGGAAVVGTYGILLSQEGRAQEALTYLKETLNHFIGIGTNVVAIRAWMMKVAEATEDAGRLEEAEVLWREAYQLTDRDLGPKAPLTVQQQFGLARTLVKQKRLEEGVPMLEKVISLQQERFGTNNFSSLIPQVFVGKAYEQQREVERAAQLYRDLHPRLAKHLPYNPWTLREIADFFVRERRYDDAKAVYAELRESFDANPSEFAADFETHLRAIAATKGWPAAAEVCRKRQSNFPGDAAAWRERSTMLLYGGNSAGYQEAAASALALARNTTNLDEQRRIAETVGLAPDALFVGPREACDRLIESLDRGLATISTNKHRWLTAMACLELRHGQPSESLKHLQEALTSNPRSVSEQARTLMVKALALHRLKRMNESRAAFEQAEALMKPRLLDRLPQREAFLSSDERTYLVFRREAQTLLGAIDSSR